MKRKSTYAALLAITFALSACAPPAEDAQKAEELATQQAEELKKAQDELAAAQEKLDEAERKAKAKADAAARANRDARETREEAAATPAPAPVCNNCGTVASIDEVRAKGDGSGIGAVAGAIAGGVLGHQFGGGRGKDVATGVGAVAGGVAGHQIERSVKSSTYYNIGVRMENGGYETVKVSNPAGLSIGAPVRVIGNDIQLR